jgi:hypothetical protein
LSDHVAQARSTAGNYPEDGFRDQLRARAFLFIGTNGVKGASSPQLIRTDLFSRYLAVVWHRRFEKACLYLRNVNIQRLHFKA